MSTSNKILEVLSKQTFYRKGMSMNFLGLPTDLFRSIRKHTLRQAAYRLKKQKYITFTDSGICITKDGERYYKKLQKRLPVFKSPFKKDSPRKLIMIFDIPESRRVERQWLRKQLMIFNYIMIQKSVWVGPSPLPTDFKEYIKDIKLEEHIECFNLKNGYIKKKK